MGNKNPGNILICDKVCIKCFQEKRSNLFNLLHFIFIKIIKNITSILIVQFDFNNNQ